MGIRNMAKHTRYAVVGLGFISQIAMLPAFANARRNSALTALVSSDTRKLHALGRRYGIDRLIDYDGYDALLRSGDVDAVYVGLPNSLHHDYTLRALRAGVHVLCDKPLALDLRQASAMVEAAKQHKAKLMTAYRLHFEPGNLAALDVVHGGKIGRPRFFSSDFSQQVKPGNIRLKAGLGGGPLYDLGIYCINAARHVFEVEPTEVSAIASHGTDRRFREVEETVQVVMRFPDDALASFTCSFGTAAVSEFRVRGTKAAVRLEQAYDMTGPKRLVVEDLDGKPGQEKTFAAVDQFAPLLVHFSDCIQNGRPVIPSGAEGLADLRVVEAIQRALGKETSVPLAASPLLGPKLTGRKAMRVPPHKPPKLLGADGPAQK
jgi:glucose-fructose oxidoreductase